MDGPGGEALLAAGAAVATPVDDDTVTRVDETFDGAGGEQDPAAMAGAVDIEHAVHRTDKVDPW
jgi:hypothetical protein